MPSSFSALRASAGLAVDELAAEFLVPVEIAEEWEMGFRPPPTHVLQSLRSLAKYAAPDKADERSIDKIGAAQPDNVLPGAGRRILSFFTGGGGLDLGFEAAGFKTVYATDLDADSCETLSRNVGRSFDQQMIVEQADIRLLDPATLPAGIDLVIGGPPCQSFSASGRRAGGAAGRLDDRGTLFEAYCRIIAAVSPAAFVFENVRGILGTNKGEDWKAIVTAFGELGYRVSYRLLDALDYGAPQQRERMFLVGHQLPDEFHFPAPTHGPDASSGQGHLTAGMALAGIDEDENLADLALSTGKYAHLLPLVPRGENYLHFTAKRGYARPVFAYRSRFSDFLYKADPDSPIKTLIASPGKYTGPFHWDNRSFSQREYKRLQGFPDDFEFHGTRQSVIRQIGNSVSPKVAERLALAVAKQIFGANANVPLIHAEQALSFDRRKSVKAQKTRQRHILVARQEPTPVHTLFRPKAYREALTGPVLEGSPQVTASVSDNSVHIDVMSDDSDQVFARMRLQIGHEVGGLPIDVCVRGKTPASIQIMWNAVDDWVQRSSDFHSLFELYGHFTEPHPIFAITSFDAVSRHPVAAFASHASDFTNCSRYFPKQQLINLFGPTLRTEDFRDIAIYLRRFRFDIRSHETNVAIDPENYMVAYPFTLPNRRQMNFSVRARPSAVAKAA